MSSVTWADVLTGDVVLGADGLAWYVQRHPRGFTLHRPDRGAPVTGRPPLAHPVERLARGATSIAVDRLRIAFPGLSILEER